MFLVFLMMLYLQNIMIYDFNSSSIVSSDWMITNDVVMGGVSRSTIALDSKGNGIFSGIVSTENNGGFAMIRHITKVSCQGKTKLVLRVKGDGKKYQFRIKSDRNQRYWYVQSFETSGNWEEIYLDINKFYPYFRGVSLNKPNFTSELIREIAILIGNKQTESFTLTLDYIKLK